MKRSILFTFAILLSAMLVKAQSHWDSVATTGFGTFNSQNFIIDSLNGKLFITTGTSQSANHVFTSPTGDYGTWAPDPAYDAMVSPNEYSMSASTPWNQGTGFLFGSTVGQSGPNVYRYDAAASNWTNFGPIPYTYPAVNFTTPSTMAIYTFGASNDTVFMALNDWNDGAQVWRSSANNPTWTEVINIGSTNANINSLTKWNGKLYFAGDPGKLYESVDGYTWNTNAFVDTNFNDVTSSAITALTVFNNELYAAVSNYTTGAQIWKTSDGVSWTEVINNGFNNSYNLGAVRDMISAYGKLWIICESMVTGGNKVNGDPTTQGGTNYAYIYYSSDGVTFSTDINNGFDPTLTTSYMWGGTMHLGSYANNIYATGMNYAGAQVWRTCVAPVPAYSCPGYGCINAPLYFSNTSSYASTYDWKVNNVIVANTQDLNYTFTATGTYNIMMIAHNGLCVDSIGSIVTIYGLPSASLGPDVTTCNDSLLMVVTASGGTAPYTYYWSNDDTNDSILLTPPNTQQWWAQVTDANGCMMTDTINITALPPSTLSGNVNVTSGPVTAGKVYLVYMDGLPEHQYVIDSTNIVSGTYTFTNVLSGNYLVYAIANASSYPNAIKSYHDTAFNWINAHIIPMQCNTNIINKNIFVLELTSQTGQGAMSGKVLQDVGYHRYAYNQNVQVPGDPIPDIDVTVEQHPGGTAITSTKTDANGHYSFAGIDPGTYDVYVDIPGLGMVSQYVRTITSNENFINLDYRVDSTKIFPDSTAMGVQNLNSNSFFKVYPNPSVGIVYIDYNLTSSSMVKLEVVDVLGKEVKMVVSGDQSEGEHRYTFNSKENSLSNGMYFIKLSIDGVVQTKKVITID